MKINKHYSKLEENYLFTEIAIRTKKFVEANPDKPLIKLGIGDVTLPLSQISANAIITAFEELKNKETFRGYGPELGYGFAKNAVVEYYKNYGVEIAMDEVTIGDGIGSDIANITDLFEKNANTILIPDPVYPLYKATSLMDGQNIVYLPCTRENNFLPSPPDCKSDIIYICSPNNPTGATFSYQQLQQWVDYANKNEAVILYDNAYERFIEESDKPHSIFEIEGSKTCAIEFGSLSKTSGFTCVRSGFTVVPLELESDGISLNKMWQQRQTTKYNGAAYPQQRGLVAALSKEGLAESDKNIAEYKKNSQLIIDTLKQKNIFYCGGTNSPYVWLQCPNNMSSWAFFDMLLNEAYIVGTPGVGFGSCGEHYFRLSTFNTFENTKQAMDRIDKLL